MCLFFFFCFTATYSSYYYTEHDHRNKISEQWGNSIGKCAYAHRALLNTSSRISQMHKSTLKCHWISTIYLAQYYKKTKYGALKKQEIDVLTVDFVSLSQLNLH